MKRAVPVLSLALMLLAISPAPAAKVKVWHHSAPVHFEKALAIDKVTREAGGQQTVAGYIQMLKRAAHERGVHISKRVLAYENFVMELRMRLRIMENADAEDRAYHDITPEKILDWARDKLAELEQVDRDFGREKGRVFVGKL